MGRSPDDPSVDSVHSQTTMTEDEIQDTLRTGRDHWSLNQQIDDLSLSRNPLEQAMS
jgi:hypothetical protein